MNKQTRVCLFVHELYPPTTMFMNTECLFTVCSRGREHEHLGEQLVNSAAASVEQDRVFLGYSSTSPRPTFLSSVGGPDSGEGGPAGSDGARGGVVGAEPCLLVQPAGRAQRRVDLRAHPSRRRLGAR